MAYYCTLFLDLYWVTACLQFSKNFSPYATHFSYEYIFRAGNVFNMKQSVTKFNSLVHEFCQLSVFCFYFNSKHLTHLSMQKYYTGSVQFAVYLILSYGLMSYFLRTRNKEKSFIHCHLKCMSYVPFYI